METLETNYQQVIEDTLYCLRHRKAYFWNAIKVSKDSSLKKQYQMIIRECDNAICLLIKPSYRESKKAEAKQCISVLGF